MSTSISKTAAQAVTNAIKSCGNQQEAVDKALRLAMQLVLASGDVRQVNRLIVNDKVQRSVHGRILEKWVSQFEYVVYSAKDKAFRVHRDWTVHLQKDSDFDRTDLLAEISEADAYYRMPNPKADFKGLSIEKMMQLIIKRAESTQEKIASGELSEEDAAKCDFRGLEQVKAALANMHSN